MAQQMQLPENIISFNDKEEYKIHLLTHKERLRLCLQIRPESKFSSQVDTNEILMDDWGIPKYILLENRLAIINDNQSGLSIK
jgi:hypothetical protein